MENRLKKWLALMSKPFIRFILFIITCVILAGCVFILLLTDPVINPFIPSCSFYRFTHLFCPGCGMTRALYAVLQGQIGVAFSYNCLWPFIVLFITGSLSMWFFYLLTGKNPFIPMNRFLRIHPSLAWIIVITLFAFWILRNIPVKPFTFLAP